jgi:hypothetical protein
METVLYLVAKMKIEVKDLHEQLSKRTGYTLQDALPLPTMKMIGYAAT